MCPDTATCVCPHIQEQLLRSEERDADLTALSNARQALEERVRALEGEARAKDAEAALLAERLALQTERAALDMREQVSSCCYICLPLLLYMCPLTDIYVLSYRSSQLWLLRKTRRHSRSACMRSKQRCMPEKRLSCLFRAKEDSKQILNIHCRKVQRSYEPYCTICLRIQVGARNDAEAELRAQLQASAAGMRPYATSVCGRACERRSCGRSCTHVLLVLAA